jgi:hypothetical protein
LSDGRCAWREEKLMSKTHPGLMVAAAFAAWCLAATPVDAAEALGTDDLGSHVCKDVMRLSGDDREIALALVHGYVLGKKGTTKFDVETLATITDKFLDYCLDNPKENALAAFEKIAR